MEKLYADIYKVAGDFKLNITIASDAKRIGILGASGSGKSMTLRSIAGIEKVEKGHIEVNGKVLLDTDSRINIKPQMRNVGYMFQSYALFPRMNVFQNVMAGLKGAKADRRARARDMLDRFHMEGFEDRLPGELSGGQQQRVALARIMVTEPELILLDEPFSALDAYLRDRMQVEMLEMLENYDGQVVMVSHNRDELYRFSEELFVMKEGQVLRHGETRSVFRDPGRVEVARLTGCKNFADVRLIDEHTIDVTSWGITLKVAGPIPEDTKVIGCRAHYFQPVWGERQANCIRFDLARVDDLLFEKNYYIRPERGKGTDKQSVPGKGTQPAPGGDDYRKPDSGKDSLICWFVQGEEQKLLEEKGLPDYLRLQEEAILYLR